MKITEWLNEKFGGDWVYNAVKGIWIDKDNANREAFIAGDNLRAVEHTLTTMMELKR